MLLFPATAPLSGASRVRLRYLVDLRIIHHLIIWLVHQATTSSIQIIATIIILHHKFIALRIIMTLIEIIIIIIVVFFLLRWFTDLLLFSWLGFFLVRLAVLVLLVLFL